MKHRFSAAQIAFPFFDDGLPLPASKEVRQSALSKVAPRPALTEDTVHASLGEIVSLIGESLTRRLCAKLGGTCRTIGAPNVDFVEAIGEEAAQALREYWGTGTIYIPRQPLTPEARYEAACRLASQGWRKRSIAQHLGLSERQVYFYLARHRAKETRPDRLAG